MLIDDVRMRTTGRVVVVGREVVVTLVVVGARVSKAGSATPQPGDLEGATQPVAVGSSGVAVTIESEIK